MNRQSLAPDRLRSFITPILAVHGVPEKDAGLVADTLVQAELWGHPSHGVLRLSWYVDRLRTGVMRPVTQPVQAVNASPAMAPWGGKRKAVGTNPWSIAAPAGRYGTAVMDIANTATARGHLAVALQIESFLPLSEFSARMETLIEEVKSVPLAEGVTEIFFPGEIEQRHAEHYRQTGLLLPEKTRDELTTLARETGLEAHLPF